MTDKRVSIPPTHDSRKTGPRYHVTTLVGTRMVEFRKPIQDPFVRQAVRIGIRDLARALLHGHLQVVVNVGGDGGIVEDVMELDDNYLGYNCTRRDAFEAELMAALSFHAGVGEILDDGSGDD